MIGTLRFWRRGVGRPKAADGQPLVRALMSLPLLRRDIFVLHRFEGLSVDEIAERFGVETEVVESELAEALAQLSQAVSAAGEGPDRGGNRG